MGRLAAIVLTCFFIGIAVTSLRDGAVIERHEYVPMDGDSQYPKALSWYRAGFKRRFRLERIRYLSDGLQISGMVAGPRHPDGRMHPVLVFNRGGNRDYDSNDLSLIDTVRPFLESGYIVIASQYRGSDGGDGRDEFGGADVDDVMNLKPIIDGIPGADPRNIFLLGISRGGMMTYLALSRGFHANAAAVIGAPADLSLDEHYRSDMIANVYEELIPKFDRARAKAYAQRSAVHWADRISVPVLILHGESDAQDPVIDSERMAEALSRHHRPHRLVVYPLDDHLLTMHQQESQSEILAWFEHYRVG